MINLALIKDNIVQNIILVENETGIEDAKKFYSDYQNFVVIDNIDPKPGVGWIFDGDNFTAPITVTE
jgi:hypothetical protein